MKNRTVFRMTMYQSAILFLFLILTVGNEFLDIPNLIFNDAATSYSQRYGEIGIEISIFIIVMILQIILLRKLYKRIRLLEGFISICANCKKVKTTKNQWQQIEHYISDHSLAKFSHSLCPECAAELYPGLYKKKDTH
ncbi:MAG: hypothetical protein PHF33_02995 [Candidatus Delongbacteria bacterium]|nr:hypothetical protein [Candidatus Delongbacteria bacterium]MDD4206076.1 hypothetical protein [Candidatus Delongbacteria bacterium]